MRAALTWAWPDGWRIAFSTAAAGDLADAARRSAWLAAHGAARDLPVPEQIHGTRILAAAEASERRTGDGIVTRALARGAGVFGSDCPGLAIMAPTAVVVAHCGWRGVAGGIVAAAVRALRGYDADPRRWQAFIGPGISAAHYQVDAAVLGARQWPATALHPDPQPGRARLDLVAAIRSDLADAGVERVAVSGHCTADHPRLWSYRRQGPGCSQLLAVWRERPSL